MVNGIKQAAYTKSAIAKTEIKLMSYEIASYIKQSTGT